VLGPYTILKEDYWSKEAHVGTAIEGAANFRQVQTLPLYGVAQPTIQGMKNVMRVLKGVKSILWINLREEPLIYLNGIPYVLRDKYLTLRNTKTYSGINPERLELLEMKLKEDLFAELDVYNGKILLHSETIDGNIEPVWEELENEGVLTLNEAMSTLNTEARRLSIMSLYSLANEEVEKLDVKYFRAPMTSESEPNPSDFDLLVKLISNVNLSSTAIILYFPITLEIAKLASVVQHLERSLLYS
jgi:Inositol hexakisphosphate